jgi:hypothetical protein
MPKYRILSLEELKSLHQEFIEFLVVNGVAAEDWERMKLVEPEKAESIIELFSDAVLETVLRKIKYVEVRTKNQIHVFQCLAESQVLVGVEVAESLGIDLSNYKDFISFDSESIAGTKVFTATKKYERSREEEIFDLLQIGGVITDNKLFNALCLSL